MFNQAQTQGGVIETEGTFKITSHAYFKDRPI